MTDDEDGLTSYLACVEEILAVGNSGERPYSVVLSDGTGYCDNDDIDGFMRAMDESMYAMKESHHREGSR